MQCSTEEGKQLLVRVIGRFEKMRDRQIGIPLYTEDSDVLNTTSTNQVIGKW